MCSDNQKLQAKGWLENKHGCGSRGPGLVYRKGGPPRGPCPGPGPPHMPEASILSGSKAKGLHHFLRIGEFNAFTLAMTGISIIL